MKIKYFGAAITCLLSSVAMASPLSVSVGATDYGSLDSSRNRAIRHSDHDGAVYKADLSIPKTNLLLSYSRYDFHKGSNLYGLEYRTPISSFYAGVNANLNDFGDDSYGITLGKSFNKVFLEGRGVYNPYSRDKVLTAAIGFKL